LPGVPSRLAEIKRDLGAMAAALASRGGGGSASELRSDAGIFFGYGVEETLSRHIDLADIDVIEVNGSPGALNTTVNVTFSFPEDHYILAVMFRAGTNPANFALGALTVRPQPQSEIILVAHTDIGQRITMTGIALVDDIFIPLPNPGTTFPLFGLAETDYTFYMRSGAGGGGSFKLVVYRITCPKGVRIPH